VDELIVRWPKSGKTQTFRNVAPNRIVRITEGRDDMVEARYPAPGPAHAGTK
jgi:hypothetical protein